VGDPRRPIRPKCLAALACRLLLPVFVAGCANAERYRGLDLSATQPASLIALPTAGQSGNSDCGYAALASVAMYHHVPTTRLVEGPIPEKFRGPRLSGDDLVQMAKMLELTAYGYEGDLDDLKSNIAKGRPVLVLLSHPPRVAQYPQIEYFGDLAAIPFVLPHWVVVVGFTADDRVVLHDPRNGVVSMSKGEFVQTWEQRSRLAILVVKQ
jgi:ABC-type bacteriocin/lantibiotic exporter with double-glycine peptidase domain